MAALYFDGAGWIGGILVVTGYALGVTRRLSATGRAFQILNIVGGCLLGLTALYRFALPNLMINVAWVGIRAGHTARGTPRGETRPGT